MGKDFKHKQKEKKKLTLQRQKQRRQEQNNLKTLNVPPQTLNNGTTHDEAIIEYEIPDLPFSADDARFEDYKQVFERINIDDEHTENFIQRNSGGQESDANGKRSKAVLRKHIQDAKQPSQQYGHAHGPKQWIDEQGRLRTKKKVKRSF